MKNIYLLCLIMMTACGASDRSQNLSTSLSLTDPGYTGKKYYLGFGDALSGFMGNEVKYDVAHTHDIFTSNAGGDYIGTKIISSNGRQSVLNKWNDIKQTTTADDMYVQYSSGHGSMTGLEFGVSYNEIRDFTLALPAKEMIVFTMACYSGNLVDSFNNRRSVWENWQSQGRTLMVMASSRSSETSSTGPGTDPDQPNSPSGSAGSAFGHALWKALIGYADGYVDGVKDGFLTLDEIIKFSKWKTQRIGGHTPVYTGVFDPNLVMNRVPGTDFLNAIEDSTEGMTEEEVAAQIAVIERNYRL